MRKTTISNTIDNISVSKECITLLIFILLFGISTGVFFEVMMETNMKSTMGIYLQNMLRSPIEQNMNFLSSLMFSAVSNVLIMILIALSGYTRFSYPVSSLVLFAKGISLGYCSALILEVLAFKGVFIVILSLFPQNTLLIPALLIFSNTAIDKSSALRYKKNKGIVVGFPYDRPYLCECIFFCMIIIAGCILQSIFLPIAARLI